MFEKVKALILRVLEMMHLWFQSFSQQVSRFGASNRTFFFGSCQWLRGSPMLFAWNLPIFDMEPWTISKEM